MKNPSWLVAIAFLFVVTLFGCKAPVYITPTNKPTSLAIKMGYRKGVIFTEDYPIASFDRPGFNLKQRFTPRKADIEEVQSVFYQQVIGKGKAHIGRYEGYPLEAAYNNSYFMQYVGLINEKGERIIHINFLWNKVPKKEQLTAEDDYKIVKGGGNHFWQININITTQKVIDLRVNGEG